MYKIGQRIFCDCGDDDCNVEGIIIAVQVSNREDYSYYRVINKGNSFEIGFFFACTYKPRKKQRKFIAYSPKNKPGEECV